MPVDSLDLRVQAPSPVAPVAGRERRQSGRARVSQELRIRPAAFNDGSFEEVRSTLNVSRDGFYFFTPNDRYHKGMRLRIAPAAASQTEADWEKTGEVVRVHRQGAGFGVAVVLSRHLTVPNSSVPSGQTNKNERRSARRQPFIATTEVIDMHRVGILARTADLSTGGCYIDTLNPLPLDTTVRLQIQKNSATVEFRARVTSCHPGSGMGLIFEGITPEQRSTLAKWISKQSAEFESASVVSPRTEGKGRFEDGQRFANLLDILTRKGILSKSEALSLLRDASVGDGL